MLELEELGLHLPQLIGGAGAATTACMTCSDKCTKLFHVRSGRLEGGRRADCKREQEARRGGGAAGAARSG